MSSKINALHWMAYHQDESDWQFIQRTNPLSVKIFQDHWRDPFFLERLYATAPRALILLRDHPLSEEKDAMTADPVGTGVRHANTWIDAAARMIDVKGFDPARTVFLGINEPGVGTPQQVEAVVAYTVAFLDQLATYGYRGGALSLSVGWPANTGTDTPVGWEPFAPVRDAIQRGNHLLILHEYFANWQGVNLNRGWWVDRLGQCPWQVSIIVGEAGADNYVDYTWASQHFDEHRRGWAGHQNTEQYVAALAEVDAIYRADHRVHSAMPFSYDFAHPWGSFDVRPIREQLATYYNSVSGEVAPLAVPRYPDKVTPPAPPQPEPDMLTTFLRDRLGSRFEDLRATLPGRGYSFTDSRAMPYLAIHHTTGPRDVTAASIARFHVEDRGYPGIGYHFMIRLGKALYVGDVDTQRAHVKDRNDEALGIAVAGDYHEQGIAEEDLTVLRDLTLSLDEWYGHEKQIVGHRDLMAPNYTTCPARLVEAFGQIRTGPIPVPLRYDKVAWGVEAIARLLATEGWVAEHNHLLASDVYLDAVEKR